MRRRLAALAGLALVLAPGLAGAAALDLFYERSVMVAANARCGLFTPAIATALEAAKAQARGASLRSGVEEDRLAQVEQQAASRAGGADCASRDVTLAAARVRQAFEGYARLNSIDYPGEIAAWRAEHVVPAAGTAGWGLAQSTRFGFDRMTFGLAVRGAGRPLMAVAVFSDGRQPFAARLVLRDRSRAPRPYLDRRMADASGHLPLPARAPPRFATQVFNAEARSIAGRDLRPRDTAGGWAFRFPAAATDALTRLDPRESVAVEFVFAGETGDIVRTAYIEVGDFAAGRAFLAMPRG